MEYILGVLSIAGLIGLIFLVASAIALIRILIECSRN
jgi:hypothetical protein